MEETIKYPSVFGVLTEEELSTVFASIFKDVKKRVHLTHGYVSFTANLGFGNVTVRTLKRKELNFITTYAPAAYIPLDKAAEKVDIFIKNQTLSVLFGLMSFEQVEGSITDMSLNADTNVSYEEFVDIPAVKEKLEFIGNLPANITSLINNLLNDVSYVFDKATRDLIKNPLTLPKP
jgi:hypothetical protein